MNRGNTSDAARIYVELGNFGAEQYARLVREENILLDKLNYHGNIDASELEKLERIRNEIYQLRQDAGIVSSR